MSILESQAYVEGKTYLEALEKMTNNRVDAIVVMVSVGINAMIREHGTLGTVSYLGALIEETCVKGPRIEFDGRFIN